MQITQNSHSPPLASKKQHLKLHIQPIFLPEANVLNKTVGNSDPDIGGKIIKTERIMIGSKQQKKFHIKQIQPNAHFRQQTNQTKVAQQENDALSIILYKQSQTATNEKHVSSMQKNYIEQMIADLKNKVEQQETIIRLQEFKINRLQQELQSQKHFCSNLILKVNSLDPKYNGITFMKISKQNPFESLQQSSLQPSLARVPNSSNNKRMMALQSQVQILKQQLSELGEYCKNTLLQSQQLIKNIQKQWVEKMVTISKSYQYKIEGLEELLKMNNLYQSQECSKFFIKSEILAQELLMSETQKEGYIQKCLQLMS